MSPEILFQKLQMMCLQSKMHTDLDCKFVRVSQWTESKLLLLVSHAKDRSVSNNILPDAFACLEGCRNARQHRVYFKVFNLPLGGP